MDFEAVRKMTENDIIGWCDKLGLDGKLNGREYVMYNPTRDDTKLGSFSINIDTGVWADFASGDTGGDMIDLWAYIRGCSKLEAAQAISGETPSTEKKKRNKKEIFTPILPEKHCSPPKTVRKMAVIESYKYPHGWILRLPCPIKGKTFSAYNYGILEKDGELKEGWHFKQIPSNRPLYNIWGAVESTVVIVEGEKACNALAEKIKKITATVTTWCGGGNAWNLTDWTPIYGKNVIIWGDTDAAGHATTQSIAQHLHDNGCNIKITDVSKFADKYDAYDWCAEHDLEETKAYIKTATFFTPPAPENIMESVPKEEVKPEKVTLESRPVDISSYISKRFQAPEKRKETESEQPYFVLGHADDLYYFYARGRGTVVSLTAEKISISNLLGLFPSLDYWQGRFPTKTGIDIRAAQESLMKDCASKGWFDDSKRRKTGAWVDNDELVIHLGNKVYLNGEFVKPSDILSEYIYEATLPVKIEKTVVINGKKKDILPEPMTDEVSQELLTLFNAVNFEHPEAAILVAGMTMFAPICGASPWRPMMWITAEAGAGKTHLTANVMGKLCGAMSLKVTSATTESGLRQSVNCSTLPVFFDESESETKKSAEAMEQVLALIRRSSSETEARSIQGKMGGRGTETFTSASSFILSSIVSTLRSAADISRFTIINLTSSHTIEAKRHFREVYEPLREKLITPDNCKSFVMRGIKNADTMLYNAEVFKVEMNKLGRKSRDADQYAPMLAGAYLYKTTEKITPEEAQSIIQRFDFDKFVEPDKIVSEQEDVFMFILSASIPVRDDPSAQSRTIGWMINHIMESEDEEYRLEMGRSVMPAASCVELLKERGIKVDFKKNKLVLFIPSQGIKSIVRHNPQWYEWHKLLLRQKDIFSRLLNDAGRDLIIRFGLQNGQAIACSLDFLRNGVSFKHITPRYISEDKEVEPF
jgi:5S rRNA maturation endonuclease (ribonuclease M5)